MTYDNKGKVALWPNKESTEENKQPRWRGHFFAHRDIKAGEQIEVSLWRNSNDNPNSPVMDGKVSDRRQTETSQQPDFDDLPF